MASAGEVPKERDVAGAPLDAENRGFVEGSGD